MASSASPERTAQTKSFVSKGRRDMALLLFALLVLFLVLLWFTFTSVREYLNIQEVMVVDYRGATFEEAEEQLRKAGLDVSFYAKAAPEEDFNTVVAQSIEPNTMIRKGRVVNLGVHLPEESFNVPNLVGLDETEAVQLLAYSKLNVGEVRYAFSDLEEGAIVSSSPPAQELLESGANVDLLISRGLSASKIEMPQLVNLPLEEAVKRLKAVGVNRIETVVADANYRRVGQVVNQRPQAGRVTMPSAPVVLYYAMNDPNVVSVPNVKGMTVQQAYDALSAVGLELRRPWITTVNDPNQPQGVLEQQPVGFAIRGTPSYLVVNGAEGTLVTPSADLTAPGANPSVIGADGLPVTDAQYAVDAFGNIIPNPTTNPATANNGVVNGQQPVPLPSFIIPISQFPQIQADGTISQDASAAFGQPFPNQLQRNLGNNPNSPAIGQVSPSGQNLQPIQPNQTSLTNTQGVTRALNVQPIQPNNQLPNVQIGLSANPTPAPNPVPSGRPLAAPPTAAVSQAIQPATDVSVRNIPISFNPKNYGFIQSAQNEYRLIIIDAQGERELIRRNLGSDEVVNTMVTMYGRGEIQTYVNGSLFQAWSP